MQAYHFDDGCSNNTFRLRVTHCGCKTILSNPLSNCKEHLTIRRMRYTEYGTCELRIGSAPLLDVHVQLPRKANGTDRKLRGDYGKVKNEEGSRSFLWRIGGSVNASIRACLVLSCVSGR